MTGCCGETQAALDYGGVGHTLVIPEKIFAFEIRSNNTVVA
jgi:hypothetical protein